MVHRSDPAEGRGLARDPRTRCEDAGAFEQALRPFDPDPAASRRELAGLVAWVQSGASTDRMAAVRESARAMRAARPARFDQPTP